MGNTSKKKNLKKFCEKQILDMIDPKKHQNADVISGFKINNDEIRARRKSSCAGQALSVPNHIPEKLLGKIFIKDNLDISLIPTLEEENLRFLEILGEGGFGIVRKAYNIQTNNFLAVKYFKMNKSDFCIEEIAAEDFILDKIQQINSPLLLQYYGIKKDPQSEQNLMVVMESGETTLQNLIKHNFYFTQNELFFILNNLVEQLVLLQKNGICNRDIKPDNFIIVRNSETNEYNFKIADFGIGCYIETKDNYQISTSEFVSCTPRFASPEALLMFGDDYEQFNYYDPFLSDVFSLGKSILIMMNPYENNQDLKEIVRLMLAEKPQQRISLLKLQGMLREKKFQNLMKSPDQIAKYISEWKANKDKGITLKEKLEIYLNNFQMYSNVAHFQEAENFVNMIEEKITENQKEIEEDCSYHNLMADIYNQLAIFYQNINQNYDKAEMMFEKSLFLFKKIYGEESLDTSVVYNNLALFYNEVQQKYDKAEEYYEKCLQIQKKILGDEHPNTTISYSNLANFYYQIRQNYDKAEEYYEKSLQIQKKVLGEEHANTAISYSNQAIFYNLIRKNYDKAEEYYEKCLQIQKKLFGNEHPSTAISYSNLAQFYNEVRKDYDKAEEFYEICLKIQKKVLGNEHPSTAISFLNYGVFLKDIKMKEEEGRKLILKAYEINLKNFGENHSNTINALAQLETSKLFSEMNVNKENGTIQKELQNCLNSFQECCNNAHFQEAENFVNMIEEKITENQKEIEEDCSYHNLMADIYNRLAIFYQNVKQNYNKAEMMFEKSLFLFKKIYGEENLDTSIVYSNLALFLNEVQQKYDKAEEYYEKCLQIQKKVLGDEHPNTAISYSNLANFYNQIQQNYDKAEEYYEKSLQIQKKVLGEEHANTAISYSNQALFYNLVRKNYDKAEEYYEKCLQIQKKLLGDEHPNTIISYSNLAQFYNEVRKDYDKADEFYKKCLQIQKKVLGDEHPSTAISFLNYGVFLKDIKMEEEEGRKLILKAYEINLKIFGENHSNTINALSWLND